MRLREQGILASILTILGLIAVINILPIYIVFKLFAYFILFIATINIWILKMRNYVSSLFWTIPLATFILHLIMYIGITGNTLNYAYGVFYTIIALSLIYSERTLKIRISKFRRKDIIIAAILALSGFLLSKTILLEPVIFFYILGPVLEHYVCESMASTKPISKVVFSAVNITVAAAFYIEISSLLIVAMIGLTLRVTLNDFRGIIGDYVLRLSSIISRYVI